ncbi:Phytochrome-like protein cph1 [Rubripirellula tenax]|uniref:histidine kinase n=1 Tax=Rubripirellula tenax TaxID=2528015 RepID=A0A5C6E7G2_9BACT|nr:ATP-binding protein [Rubripirellula tenax]TWU43601.1 Phytochrome-like protein cph1 [Rubripirellula tenax]
MAKLRQASNDPGRNHLPNELTDRRFKPMPLVGGLLFAIAILIVVWQLDRAALSIYQSQVRENVARELAAVRGAAEITINRRIHLILGLKAHVSINPDMTEQEFADLSANLMSEAVGIQSVTSIKDNVINDVYPRAGNEDAIGMDLLGHPDQRSAAEFAIETGQPWLAGPITLVQGGEAFIHRSPVHVTPPGGKPGSGKYWGMVSIVIDKEALVSEVLAQVPSEISIAMRSRTETGKLGELFLGDASIEHADPIVTSVSLPTGRWQLYGVPKNGWPHTAPHSTLRRCLGLISAAIIGCLVYLVLHSNGRYRESTRSLEIASREAQAAEKRLRMTIAASPGGMVMFDDTGAIVMVNHRMQGMFGYTEDEMNGQSIRMLLPVDLSDIHLEGLLKIGESAVSLETSQPRDVEGRHKDGHPISLQVALNPVHFESGQCILASVVDMTERVQIEKDVREANVALRRSNYELEQFAYVASHDLQEPLRKVSSFCQILEQDYGDKLEGDGKKYMSYIVDGAERMRGLIKDLLTFSRIQYQPDEAQEFDANTALENALYSLQGSIDEAGAVVTHDDLPTIHANDRQFTQLLQNLIGNGIKYRGVAAPKIHVGVGDIDDRWMFSVADNGIGIAPEFHDRVFGIFKRLHGRDEYSGTGIGLAICKRIVEQLGGDIWIESDGRHGSTFWFTLPKTTS